MIPVADATGRDLSPSGLAGFAGLIEHTGPDTPANEKAEPNLFVHLWRKLDARMGTATYGRRKTLAGFSRYDALFEASETAIYVVAMSFHSVRAGCLIFSGSCPVAVRVFIISSWF